MKTLLVTKRTNRQSSAPL